MSEKNLRVAIVPGSFDPITLGHIDIVRRAAELYDKVYLAVMINADKEYMFTLEERRRIAEAASADIERVEVISSEGYLWKLAAELGACAIVKGVRNDVDREYELKMAEYNAERNPNAETVLLDSDSSLCHVSSTAAREILLAGGDLSGYLPESAIRMIDRLKNS